MRCTKCFLRQKPPRLHNPGEHWGKPRRVSQNSQAGGTFVIMLLGAVATCAIVLHGIMIEVEAGILEVNDTWDRAWNVVHACRRADSRTWQMAVSICPVAGRCSACLYCNVNVCHKNVILGERKVVRDDGMRYLVKVTMWLCVHGNIRFKPPDRLCASEESARHNLQISVQSSTTDFSFTNQNFNDNISKSFVSANRNTEDFPRAPLRLLSCFLVLYKRISFDPNRFDIQYDLIVLLTTFHGD